MAFNVKDKRPKNESGEAHGYWMVYWPEFDYDWPDQLLAEGKFVNGERVGLWVYENSRIFEGKQYYINT